MIYIKIVNDTDFLMARYKNYVAFLALLTSGNTEILLFSRFSSSNSRHLAKDLGMADNLLYLRPKRLMLARLPAKKKKVFTLLFWFLPLFNSSAHFTLLN